MRLHTLKTLIQEDKESQSKDCLHWTVSREPSLGGIRKVWYPNSTRSQINPNLAHLVMKWGYQYPPAPVFVKPTIRVPSSVRAIDDRTCDASQYRRCGTRKPFWKATGKAALFREIKAFGQAATASPLCPCDASPKTHWQPYACERLCAVPLPMDHQVQAASRKMARQDIRHKETNVFVVRKSADSTM